VSNPELKSQARLYGILARNAKRAVVFRRGPNKQVLLVLWNTETDEFAEGQWLKGRIYERRCDLSPNGQLLIYFAASFRKPYYSWTAISKPPFLTVLALWPKGDCWGGGGLFKNGREILLNHRAEEMKLAESFALPRVFQVNALHEHAGRGEDNPIEHMRLTRDGWRFVQDGRAVQHGAKQSVWIRFEPPMIYAKPNLAQRSRYELQRQTHGLNERQGAWYITEHVVRDQKSGETVSLGRTDWADWCHSGDLLFGKDGQLYRLGFGRDGSLKRLSEAKLLIDLTDRTFRELPPTTEAAQWTTRSVD